MPFCDNHDCSMCAPKKCVDSVRNEQNRTLVYNSLTSTYKCKQGYIVYDRNILVKNMREDLVYTEKNIDIIKYSIHIKFALTTISVEQNRDQITIK